MRINKSEARRLRDKNFNWAALVKNVSHIRGKNKRMKTYLFALRLFRQWI